MFVCSLGPGGGMELDVAEFDSHWMRTGAARFRMLKSSFNPHDFALTASYYVFFQAYTLAISALGGARPSIYGSSIMRNLMYAASTADMHALHADQHVTQDWEVWKCPSRWPPVLQPVLLLCSRTRCALIFSRTSWASEAQHSALRLTARRRCRSIWCHAMAAIQ